MEAKVDEGRCTGHGRCRMAAPTVFHLDDESGLASVLVTPIPEEFQKQARAAAATCPERAISIDGDTA